MCKGYINKIIRRSFISVIVALLVLSSPLVSWGATWYVNSRDGNDLTGTGTSASPFKTITHALEVSSDGDNIRVEVGEIYDITNGEVFPIRIKRGVNIQGMWIPIIDGRLMPEIRGGARYDIPDSPIGRFVTILCADDASISGFHFVSINSSIGVSDGSSILCDSTSTIIQDNVFDGDGHAGVTTLGNAHPIIRDNDFTGNVVWGITAYGESYPQIESNDFSALNGVDCTAYSHPVIDGNTFSCRSTGISTKGWSDATIINNTITENGSMGIIVRMDSTPMIQDNVITENPTGIWINQGNPNPDLGGGGRSHGGNTFNNTEWDIENRTSNNIMARNNQWSHSPCCESIDSEDIHDDDENPMYGAVDFSPCSVCTMVAPIPEPPPELPRESLFLIDCGPCPACFEKFCDPRVNPELDLFLIWDPLKKIAESFSRSRIGLKTGDGPLKAAAPLKGWRDPMFVASAPYADSKEADVGAVLFFNKSGDTVVRIDGKIQGERLGLDMDVREDEVVVVSTQRLMCLKEGKVIYEMSFPKNLFANRGIHVAFTEDVDGDKRPEILIGAPYASIGKYQEAGQIQIIGSKSEKIIDVIYGRTRGQHLGEILQSIDLSLKQMK
jgi:parallel beta-helix repeat protein